MSNDDLSNKPIKQIYDGYMNDASPVPRTAIEFGQPAPIPNDKPALWPMVIEDFEKLCRKYPMKESEKETVISDMMKRDEFGRSKYGTPLQAGNGRDPLKDAYEELLDASVYLKQSIEEMKRNRHLLPKYARHVESTYRDVLLLVKWIREFTDTDKP